MVSGIGETTFTFNRDTAQFTNTVTIQDFFDVYNESEVFSQFYTYLRYIMHTGPSVGILTLPLFTLKGEKGGNSFQAFDGVDFEHVRFMGYSFVHSAQKDGFFLDDNFCRARYDSFIGSYYSDRVDESIFLYGLRECLSSRIEMSTTCDMRDEFKIIFDFGEIQVNNETDARIVYNLFK